MKENDKPKLKDIIAEEKGQMLPLNFFSSYVLVPVYLILTLLLLIVFGV